MSTSGVEDGKCPDWRREPAWARVQREQSHECLYHVAGPCSHPKCLEARYRELVAAGSPP